jgi:hypothetical protein
MGGPAEVLLRIRILLGILFVIAGVIVLGDVIVATTISTIVIGAVRLLGTNDCSGRALSGHVAAPPSSMMNSRRFITQSPRRRGRGASAASCTIQPARRPRYFSGGSTSCTQT